MLFKFSYKLLGRTVIPVVTFLTTQTLYKSKGSIVHDLTIYILMALMGNAALSFVMKQKKICVGLFILVYGLWIKIAQSASGFDPKIDEIVRALNAQSFS